MVQSLLLQKQQQNKSWTLGRPSGILGHPLVQNPFCLVTIDLWSPVHPTSFKFTKHRNILAFHRVREVIAVPLYWIQAGYNLSDMLSKHWDHPTAYPMVLKLLITRGNITLIPREATQEKEKENLNMQPEKEQKKEKQEYKSRKKMTNTPTTRGEQQKNIHDISLSILL